MTQVSVIILAYGDEPLLGECVTAALDSNDVEVEVVIVDNGSASIGDVPEDPRVQVITPGENTGFAGGCNLGASQANFDRLVFVNSDLIVRPDAITLLNARLDDEAVGLATGAVLLPGDPPRVNSIGNPIHYLLFSWAGAFGEPFANHNSEESVAGISGAFFGCRRDHWDHVHGFDPVFFAYAEDADLSLRTWQSGKSIRFEPRAVGIHHYQFTKNNTKWFLLERNRLICLSTLYNRRSRWLLMPVVVPVELGVLWAAWRGGWAREKINSWRWILANAAYLRERRHIVDNAKRVNVSEWTNVFSGEMHIPAEFGLRVPAPANWLLGIYWRAIVSRVA
ncbi:MAG TPA: glycosyltransferase [Acidimicrobiales bacterium]